MIYYMLRHLCSVLLLCLLTSHSYAQSFYKVTNLSGTEPIAGNAVTVHHIGYVANAYSACATGPYRISNYRKKDTGQDTCRAYVFAFAEPVTKVRVRLTNVGPSELISFHVNGSFYPISPNSLSDYGGTCKGALQSIVKNGRVGGDTSNTNALVTIDPGFLIDSVMVYYDTNDDAGVHFSFEFESNPKISIKQPFFDTTKCVGDSLKLKFDITAIFNTGNFFNAELSDANGSFANPVIIGSTKDSMGKGIIPCMIPGNTPQGTGYRLRVTTTSPARVTQDNGINIRITPYPKTNVTSNSPVCEKQDIRFTINEQPETVYFWTGNDFKSNQPNPTVKNANVRHTGKYIVSASTYGCVSHDTTAVVVKPLPIITNISSNSPLCEADTLKLLVKSNNNKDTFLWYGPASFTHVGASTSKLNIIESQAGIYSAVSYYDGCYSDTAKTDVVIKTKPAFPVATNNSPVYPGDPLNFTGACNTPGITLEWTGPDGFYSTENNPVIPSPTNTAEGDYTLTATLGGCKSSVRVWATILDKDFFTMFPNPNNGSFNIKVNVLKDQAIKLEVINFKGDVVYRETNQTRGNVLIKKVTLDRELPIGQYILRLGIDEHSRNIKFRINY
jgi:hypothetical protein